MPRHASRPHVARRLVAGALRRDEPGAALDCLLLAPAPDWVLLDLATGALVRSPLAAAEAPPLLRSEPLGALRLELGSSSEPFDPSRPEAVVAAAATGRSSPRRRRVRRLLEQVAGTGEGRPLLGSVGPSVSFADLEGNRPSVALLSPAKGRVVLAGEGQLTAHFGLGDASHSLPVAAGLLEWLRSGQLPTSSGVSGRRAHRAGRRRPGPLGPALEPAVPVRVVVGFDRPERGQVRKVLFGLVPSP